jgi:predicted house-cleaning NTP pyrophosphatase (Maf/HAM1 superfamily)
VQYSLDRIYTSRISLNMLTDQHLMVYGHLSTALDQASAIQCCGTVTIFYGSGSGSGSEF